ncbi:nipped-B-like protein A [Alligator mississippiensis]|uniref:nipped-B-like protein A n=1 Tax=Alligator mississippiensis TaxID=8496 RepID=UPI002877825F|nr:nipped-B-like protein A [Alligator mississippiensis]
MLPPRLCVPAGVSCHPVSPSPSSPVTSPSRPQVMVSMKVEEGMSDRMQPTGMLQEPGDSWPEQPQAKPTDVSLEDAAHTDSPGPQDQQPFGPREEPLPNPEPDAGALGRAHQKPLEEGPANLELPRTSPGRPEERGSLSRASYRRDRAGWQGRGRPRRISRSHA